MKTLTERFWEKVDKRGPYECWVWTGARRAGRYGALRWNGAAQAAHRVSWAIHTNNFSLAQDTAICHRCDNGMCVNPAHLFAGSQLDNMRDCALKGRNTGRFSRVEVEQIRLAYQKQPVALTVLATHLGITESSVHDLLCGKTYTYARFAVKIQKQSRGTGHKIEPDHLRKLRSIGIANLNVSKLAREMGVAQQVLRQAIIGTTYKWLK